MKYLIVQDWKSTQGNHAGMVHMCNLLVEKYPNEYRIICMHPVDSHKPYNSKCLIANRIINKLFSQYRWKLYVNKQRKIIYPEYLELCSIVFEEIKKGDEIFLLEYNVDEAPQMGLANYFRNYYPFVKLYALSHLTPSLLKRRYSRKELLMNDKCIDRELTLGTSLSQYLINIGIKREKISTGFHYVDLDYYRNSHIEVNCGKKITIIAIGFLQRNFKMLSQIVKSIPSVNWIICRGRNKSIDELFVNDGNVSLKGFMSEEELRNEMSKADISLNVFEDTVGSNVITTSMAMGLAIVASDVGSIRDYCDESNAVFCKNEMNSFIEIISNLVNDHERLNKMRLASIEKAQRLRIENVHAWFMSLKSR